MSKLTTLSLKCTKCGRTGSYDVGQMFLNTKGLPEGPERILDNVAFTGYFRCKCGSAWPWELTEEAISTITAIVYLKLISPDEIPWIEIAEPVLFDNTPHHTAATAEEHLKTILEKEPDNAFLWNRLGNIYHHAGMLKEAKTALRRAIELNPNDIKSNYTLGEILYDEGNFKESAQYLHQVEQLAPTDQVLSKQDKRDCIRGTLDMLIDMFVASKGKISPFPPPEPGVEIPRYEDAIDVGQIDLANERDWERMVNLIINPPKAAALAGRKGGKKTKK